MKNIAFMMISMMSVFHSAHALRIEVFTTTRHVVALDGREAKVCELDALTHLTQRVNQPNVVHPSVKNSLERYTQPFTAYYRCQNKALSYELKYLPAIVLNNRFVVYGVPSVATALSMLRRHQGAVHD